VLEDAAWESVGFRGCEGGAEAGWLLLLLLSLFLESRVEEEEEAQEEEYRGSEGG